MGWDGMGCWEECLHVIVRGILSDDE
jgi:hypothetical protein